LFKYRVCITGIQICKKTASAKGSFTAIIGDGEGKTKKFPCPKSGYLTPLVNCCQYPNEYHLHIFHFGLCLQRF